MKKLRIGFVENRSRTTLWAAVAQHLQQAGHEIVWLVQNHGFSPGIGQVTKIAYPTRKDMVLLGERPELSWLARSDRGAIHFAAGTGHYAYYSDKICAWLQSSAPDIVFGECTLFHELLTIFHCASLGIPYVEPSGTRYPPGRLTFHHYPDMQLDAGRVAATADSGISELEIEAHIAAIVNRSVVPTYLNRRKASTPSVMRWRALARIAWARWRGERYNTPSAMKKLSLAWALRKRLAQWDALAAQKWTSKDDPGTSKRVVLLPLQMQPESNIDCWGDEVFRDQAELAMSLARLLGGRGELWVKANPHAKYEMTEKLIEALRVVPNLIPIPRGLKMEAIASQADAIVTVTGTIAIEALLSDKPLYLLSDYLSKVAPNAPHYRSLDAFPQFVTRLDESTAGVALTMGEKHAMLRGLYDCSFRGLPGEPSSDPGCLEPDNVAMISEGFRAVLADLQKLRVPVKETYAVKRSMANVRECA
jgi:Capsule polysaccharide biosynthesis protein